MWNFTWRETVTSQIEDEISQLINTETGKISKCILMPQSVVFSANRFRVKQLGILVSKMTRQLGLWGTISSHVY